MCRSKFSEQKKNAGFETTLSDFWTALFAPHLVRADGGGDVAWSSIPRAQAWGTMPYPIVIANGRLKGEIVPRKNGSVFEFTPHEFGSWNPGEAFFFPMRFLGTAMRNGTPEDADYCVANYDAAAFVMGTSSSLFNAAVTVLDAAPDDGAFMRRVKAALHTFFARQARCGVDAAHVRPPRPVRARSR